MFFHVLSCSIIFVHFLSFSFIIFHSLSFFSSVALKHARNGLSKQVLASVLLPFLLRHVPPSLFPLRLPTRRTARNGRCLLCRWRTGRLRGVLRLLLWRFPLLSLRLSLPLSPRLCALLSEAAVALGVLPVTGTQRQVETILLRRRFCIHKCLLIFRRKFCGLCFPPSTRLCTLVSPSLPSAVLSACWSALRLPGSCQPLVSDF